MSAPTANPAPNQPADEVVPFDVFSVIERTGSVFSLIGCIFIISTFCLSKAFHKPINRLVFYASFGNLMTNVATLIARSFIKDEAGAGCQFQAFLIQMFMPADAFWTLAMAVNVYLTFYFKFDAQRLRRMEIPYIVCCYGVPFIIALTYIFVNTPGKGRMYGNAVLWCWIDVNWDIFRIATFYGPVWIAIVITFFIYTRAGREIYKKHRQLRDFSVSHHEPEPARAHPSMDDPFSSSKTTEVFVTTEVVGSDGALGRGPQGAGSAAVGFRRGSTASSTSPKPPDNAAYSVTISSNRRAPVDRQSYGDVGLPIQSNTPIIAPPIAPVRSTTGATTTVNPLRRRAAFEQNNATWSYTKCSLLFFTAMLITWLPSSANRVYSIVHDQSTVLALEYMSALVLPLQGFWNAVIYIVTSWKACKMLFDGAGDSIIDSKQRRGGGGPKVNDLVGVRPFQMMTSGRKPTGPRSGEKPYGYESSESMTELAKSRPSTTGDRSSPENSPRQLEYPRDRL